MKVFSWFFLILSLLQRDVNAYAAEAAEVIQVIRLGISLVKQVHNVVEDLCDPQCNFDFSSTKSVNKAILKQYNRISAGIQEVESSVMQVQSMFHTLQSSLPYLIKYELKLDRLEQSVNRIWRLYNLFQFYQEKKDQVETHTLLDFALSLTSHEADSISAQLYQLHRLIVPNGAFKISNGLFRSLANNVKNEDHLCGLSESPHQLLYNLYNIVALTELKGYAMLQFSYMILRINNKGNFTVEAERAKSKFSTEAEEKLKKVEEILPSLSRRFRRCDPPSHVEGQTFLQVKGFLQGYIENEVDMNEWGSCKSQCSDYTYTEPKGCYKDMFCAKQKRCGGRIFDCEFYHADAWVCMSEDPGRRYDWVEYEDGTFLGENKQCRNKIKVDSWWRYIFWHCSYCLCKCDEITETSERYWSLEAAEADTEEGRVVTGARFVKKDKVFHLQIQQAKALPEGGILESSKEWKEPVSVSSENLTTNPKVYTMSFEQRALDLDQLSAPPGYVLTGLKLRSIGGHLNLEIQATPIKFSTAELVKEQSIWIANDNTPATLRPRKLLPIIIPDVPTRLLTENKIDGTHDQYLQFDTSSAHKDVAQSTIPFLDSQPVAPSPATWLSGAGIYHKGRVGFGGFVGLSVETYDFSRHLLAPSNNNQQAQVKVEFVKAEGA